MAKNACPIAWVADVQALWNRRPDAHEREPQEESARELLGKCNGQMQQVPRQHVHDRDRGHRAPLVRAPI